MWEHHHHQKLLGSEQYSSYSWSWYLPPLGHSHFSLRDSINSIKVSYYLNYSVCAHLRSQKCFPYPLGCPMVGFPTFLLKAWLRLGGQSQQKWFFRLQSCFWTHEGSWTTRRGNLTSCVPNLGFLLMAWFYRCNRLIGETSRGCWSFLGCWGRRRFWHSCCVRWFCSYHCGSVSLFSTWVELSSCWSSVETTICS